MTDIAARPSVASQPFTPPASKRAVTAEFISCILAGRPFPAALTPRLEPPRTIEEGIRRILVGHAPRH